MTKQILVGLEESRTDAVFLCEHDILYDPSHFDFTPTEDKFYFNVNNWRWDYPKDRLITYDGLRSLSGLCANRMLLLKYFRDRLKTIQDNGWEDTSREPKWVRRLGHEPKENCIEWKSEYPNIDIRHGANITRRKCNLADFRKKPVNWQETTLKNVQGFDLRGVFGCS